MCTHVASHWRDTHTHTLLCTPAVSTHLHSTGTQTIAARGRVCSALPVPSAHALSSQPRLCHGDRLPTVLHGSPWTPCAAPPPHTETPAPRRRPQWHKRCGDMEAERKACAGVRRLLAVALDGTRVCCCCPALLTSFKTGFH